VIPERTGAVFGVDEDFWTFVARPGQKSSKRICALNQALADQLHAHIGEEVIIRVGAWSFVGGSAVMPAQDAALSMRLKVAESAYSGVRR